MTGSIPATIPQLLQAYRSRKLGPAEVCENLLQRIEKHDSKIGAFLRLDRDGIRRACQEAEKKPDLPLSGIPIAMKDVISTRGIETTCGSRILQGYVPPFDATAVSRLKDAGAVILGKTNCDEFAMGSSTENSAYQITRNPWDAEYAPGGSSGGSAAAVAAGFAMGALGTDTGGSIRQPASFCGIVGLKPTYGRVSRYGLAAFGSSLDCIGPLARTVEDAALLLNVIAGYDPKDATSSNTVVLDYSRRLGLGRRKVRIGVPREYFEEGIHPDVRNRIQSALDWLQGSNKVELIDISLPHTKYAISVYYLTATAEASANLSRYDGVRFGLRAGKDRSIREMYGSTRSEGFGAEVKRRIMLGTFALSAGYYDAYYLRASKARTLIADDFRNAFENVNLICTPTAPTPPFKIGEKVDDPLSMYLSDIYTVTASLAGLPAISIPCGMSSGNLPVGLQIIGNYMEEDRILALASYFMQNHPVHFPELM